MKMTFNDFFESSGVSNISISFSISFAISSSLVTGFFAVNFFFGLKPLALVLNFFVAVFL